jgi:hypothetical protein
VEKLEVKKPDASDNPSFAKSYGTEDASNRQTGLSDEK